MIIYNQIKGIGATVDSFRNASQASCTQLAGFQCYQGQYCSDTGTSVMADYYFSSDASLSTCAELCSSASQCTFFVFTPAPTTEFPACRLARHPVTGKFGTARGYSCYVKTHHSSQ